MKIKKATRKELVEALADAYNQFAIQNKEGFYFSGLSTLELIADILVVEGILEKVKDKEQYRFKKKEVK